MEQQQQQHVPVPPIMRRNRSRIRLSPTNSLRTDASFDNNNHNNVNNNTPMNHNNNSNYRGGSSSCRSSYIYVLFSTFVALLAIISPPTKKYYYYPTTMSSSSSSNNNNNHHHHQPSTKLAITATTKIIHRDTAPTSSTSTDDNNNGSGGINSGAMTSAEKNLNLSNSKSNNNNNNNKGRSSATTSSSLPLLGNNNNDKQEDNQNHKLRLLQKYDAEIIMNDNNYNSVMIQIQNENQNIEEGNNNNHNPMVNLFGKKHYNNYNNNNNNNHVQDNSSSNNNINNKSKDNINKKENDNNNNNNGLPFIKWFVPRKKKDNHNNNNVDDDEIINMNQDNLQSSSSSSTATSSTTTLQRINATFVRILYRFIDPSLLQYIQESFSFTTITPSASSSSTTTTTTATNNDNNEKDVTKTATHIFDKIIHSTPRLVAIANLLLAGTYLLHSIVADFFLGDGGVGVAGNTVGNVAATRTIGTGAGAGAGGGRANNINNMVGIGGVGASTSNRIHRSGRERLGGYLLFKLLLISAVVEPDTLDLLILLSWYTLLSFLKSLSFLAGITTAHAAASGQMPHAGVCKLLVIVLICDISAAVTCTALFHAAGWGMVILLTCDCALLALDVLTHLMRYFQQVIDERHQSVIADMEARQIRMYEMSRNENETLSHSDGGDNNYEFREEEEEQEEAGVMGGVEVDNNTDSDDDIHALSRQLDHEMEILEATNTKRLAILDNIAFILEICALTITTCHFMHIWSLHGVSFNLVDGVLALHLHSAVSAIGKKIAERRNHNRIARDLDNFFEDVTDLELKKACAAGDVCCICLGTMSMGNVKKIGCGHIYHTSCLREVVERARSFEGARCPLCRQSIVDGSRIPSPQSSGMPQPFIFGGFPAGGNNNNQETNNNNIATPTMPPRDNATGNRVNLQPNDLNGTGGGPNQNERALFRFSTEGILPAWLPLPAFSFEVVRRPPLGADGGGENVIPPQMQNRGVGNNGGQQQRHEQQQQEEGQPQSFWRRLLILAGIIPMSPEEEAVALAQLVDMFPQYERVDLLRELRERGSAEAVVESILGGIFSGVDRGAVINLDDANNNNAVEQEVEIEDHNEEEEFEVEENDDDDNLEQEE